MNEPERIRAALTEARTIAVVGCSPNPARPSNSVARYLLSQGYRVIPVNPAHATILGQVGHPSLDAVPPEIALDIVDVFRDSSHVAELVEPSLRRRIRFFWMQEGVIDPVSARRLEEAGIGVAMDRCILKEHIRLPGTPI